MSKRAVRFHKIFSGVVRKCQMLLQRATINSSQDNKKRLPTVIQIQFMLHLDVLDSVQICEVKKKTIMHNNVP